MKILIGVWHPAHVHFFRNTIFELRRQGHEVFVAARKKESTYNLLKKYGIGFTPISSHKETAIGKLGDFFKRWQTTYNYCKKIKPDIALGISDFYFAQIGKILGFPSFVFTDSEPVLIDPFLTYPFSTHIFTPKGFSKDLGRKHIRYDGFHEIAYLHPKYFEADVSVLSNMGIEEGERYVIMRFVSWAASHDFGRGGFTLDDKKKIIMETSKHVKVFVSSESELPDEIKDFAIQIPVDKIHDALFFASLFVGDSQTMATEAAILGTPTIRSNSFVGDNDMSNFIELEDKYGLMYNIRDSKLAIEKAVELCLQKDIKSTWIEKRKKIFEDKLDVTDLIVKTVIGFPESVNNFALSS